MITCEDYDVKLENEGDSTGLTPYIFWNHTWTPICGEYFWNNNEGATLICQKLGYDNGTQTNVRATYPQDSFMLGMCKSGDTLFDCTGGCNDYIVGGYCSDDAYKHCNKDGEVKVTIQCSGGSSPATSYCQGRMISFSMAHKYTLVLKTFI